MLLVAKWMGNARAAATKLKVYITRPMPTGKKIKSVVNGERRPSISACLKVQMFHRKVYSS